MLCHSRFHGNDYPYELIFMQSRLFYFFSFLLLLLPIKALACDCEQIKQQKYCHNPDCITLCNLTEIFDEEHSANAQMCLALSTKQLSRNFEETNMGALGLSNFVQSAKQLIEEIEQRDRETLKQTQKKDECTDCELFPELNIELDTVPKGTPCPDKYLKEHSFKRTETFPQSETCFKDINSFFKDYVAVVLSIPFAGVKWKNKKRLQEEKRKARKLNQMCPNNCSYQTIQTVKVNHELCTGSIDLTVHCTHKKSSNNISIDYKRRVQCKE